MMRLCKPLSNHPHFFLILTLIGFILLRIPSLFEPYWYRDEGIYQTIGMSLHHGLTLYTEVWDNKPPLLYSMYGLFNGDQFSLRFLSLFVGLITIVVFFLLTQSVFKKVLSGIIATVVFSLLFALPLFDSNIANAENFILLPILLGYLTVLKYQAPTRLSLFITGIYFSIALLIKFSALFDLIAAFIFLLYVTPKKIGRISLFAGCILPWIIISIYLFLHGSFLSFLTAVFTGNIGYVAYHNAKFFPYDLLIFKVTLLGLFISSLFRFRNMFSRPATFIFLILTFELFGVFFSQRPYVHYLLLILPGFSLLVGLLIEERGIRILGALLIVITIVAMFRFSYNTSLIHYYSHFLNYIMGKESRDRYFASFDPAVLRNYRIAQYIKTTTKKEETVFIWGDDAQLYKLSEKIPPTKFTVAYHILGSKQNINEVQDTLNKKKPTYLILLPEYQYPFSLSQYRLKQTIDTGTIYERHD